VRDTERDFVSVRRGLLALNNANARQQPRHKRAALGNTLRGRLLSYRRFRHRGKTCLRWLRTGPTKVRLKLRSKFQHQLLTLVIECVRQSETNDRLAEILFPKAPLHRLDLTFIKNKNRVRPIHQILSQLVLGKRDRTCGAHLQVRTHSVQMFGGKTSHLVLPANEQHPRLFLGLTHWLNHSINYSV